MGSRGEPERSSLCVSRSRSSRFCCVSREGPKDCGGAVKATANTAFSPSKSIDKRLILIDFHARPWGKIAANCGSTQLP